MKLKIITLGLLLLSGHLEASFFPEEGTVQGLLNVLQTRQSDIRLKQESFNKNPTLDMTLRPWMHACLGAVQEIEKPYQKSYIERVDYTNDYNTANPDTPLLDLNFISVNNFLFDVQTFTSFAKHKDLLYNHVRFLISDKPKNSPYVLMFDHFNTLINTTLQAINIRTCRSNSLKPHWQDPAWTQENLNNFLEILKRSVLAMAYGTLETLNPHPILNPLIKHQLFDIYNEDIARRAAEILTEGDNLLTKLEQASRIPLEIYKIQLEANRTQGPADDVVMALEDDFSRVEYFEGFDLIAKKIFLYLQEIATNNGLTETWFYQSYHNFNSRIQDLTADGLQGICLENLKLYQKAWHYVTFIKLQGLIDGKSERALSERSVEI